MTWSKSTPLHFSVLFFTGISIALSSCTSSEQSKVEASQALESIIPKPSSVKATGNFFSLNKNSTIYIESASDELARIGKYLGDRLAPATGFEFPVSTSAMNPVDGSIYLSTSGDLSLGDEGYELIISEDNIKLSAHRPAGLFRGIQTIRQLLPAKIEMTSKQEGPWKIATAMIRDISRYAHRGAMLDVARHFFSVNDVKRFIDLISYYKMNVIHLGLTNDQGWRIEIKSWPNLATHGGSTQVGGGKGGFYTQDQYTDIVKYAQSRYIMLIPEIDMPGHSNAALASYGDLNGGTIVPEEGRVKIAPSTQKELNGKSKPTELYTGIEVGFSTLRVEKKVTFKFINDVIHELAAITPGPYIHIGGDESHATRKEDYITFVKKFHDIVKANGKKMIGWEEIAQGEINSDDVTQFWTKPAYGEMALAKGSKLIMSPSKKTYMDMQYDSTTHLGLHWAGYIEVDSAYIWDPENYVSGGSQENILGVEAPLWTETISTMDDIEYMIFPRLPGYAEIGWSSESGRNWEEYKVRLANQAPRWKAMNIDYYKSKLVPWKE